MEQIKGKAKRTWTKTSADAMEKISRKLGYDVMVDDAGEVLIGYNTDGEKAIGKIEFQGENWVYIPNN